MYVRAGVAHLWLVDPIARTLEVYRLEDGRGSSGVGNMEARAEPFDAVPFGPARRSRQPARAPTKSTD